MKKFLVTADDGFRQIQEGPLTADELSEAVLRVAARLGTTEVVIEVVEDEE